MRRLETRRWQVLHGSVAAASPWGQNAASRIRSNAGPEETENDDILVMI